LIAPSPGRKDADHKGGGPRYLLPSCKALSSSTACRFIPAH
jgi:hypothetical protein